MTKFCNRFTVSALVFCTLGLTISTRAEAPIYHPPAYVLEQRAEAELVAQKEADEAEQYRAQKTQDHYWLSRTGHGEASGLTEREEEEVLCVIMNRVEHPNFPNTIKEVVLQYKQFSMYNEGNSNKSRTYNAIAAEKHSGATLRSINLAMKVRNQKPSDRILPTDVLHYHAKYANPSWAKDMPVYSSSGAHIFYGGGFHYKQERNS